MKPEDRSPQRREDLGQPGKPPQAGTRRWLRLISTPGGDSAKNRGGGRVFHAGRKTAKKRGIILTGWMERPNSGVEGIFHESNLNPAA
jgi:hypothetical protein